MKLICDPSANPILSEAVKEETKSPIIPKIAVNFKKLVQRQPTIEKKQNDEADKLAQVLASLA